jgi:hypothetical protein
MMTGMLTWAIGRFALDISAPYLKAMALSAIVYMVVAVSEDRRQGDASTA